MLLAVRAEAGPESAGWRVWETSPCLTPLLSTTSGGELAGEVILPNDPGYDSAHVVWNGMIDRYPAIVVRPTGVADTDPNGLQERRRPVTLRRG
jgi:hypothetical protein